MESSSKSPSSTIELRLVEQRDFPALASLLAREWPTVPWEERFQRQWLDNPALTPDLAMGWVHEDEEGLGAYFGSIPLPYRVNGQDAVGFAATALYVDPRLRGCGLGTHLIRAWAEQPGGQIWINSTPNAPSARLFDTLGFARDESRSDEAVFDGVASPYQHALGSLRARWEERAVLRALIVPASLAGGAFLQWKNRRLGRGPSEWKWERVGAADPVLDELWQRTAPLQPTTLRRDTRTLQWLFAGGPHADRNHLLLGRDGQGTPRLLAAFREDRERSHLRQVDLYGDRSDPRAVIALCRAALTLARAERLATVRLYTGEPAEIELLAGLGLTRSAAQGTIFYRIEGGTPTSAPRSFSRLDGDSCLEVLV